MTCWVVVGSPLLVLLGFVGLLTVVPAILAAARLARRRRPVLTTIAVGINLLAYLGGGLPMFGVDQAFLVGGQLPVEQRDAAASLIDGLWSTGILGIAALLFVIGHGIGAILLGFALRGSIPAVGWIAMVLSVPAHYVVFIFFPSPVMDMLAWWLMALAFAFCAVAVVRTPDDEWDLPPYRS